jgi:hypothetical protein
MRIIGDFLPAPLQLLPDMLVLAGMILSGYGLVMKPQFNEVFAPMFADELYLTSSSGDIILSRQFTDAGRKRDETEQSRLEDEFMASSIVGIDGLLRELSAAKGVVKTVVHQNKVLLIERGEKVIGVLVARADLQGLRTYLRDVIDDVELTFPKESGTPGPIKPAAIATMATFAEDWFTHELQRFGQEPGKPEQGWALPVRARMGAWSRQPAIHGIVSMLLLLVFMIATYPDSLNLWTAAPAYLFGWILPGCISICVFLILVTTPRMEAGYCQALSVINKKLRAAETPLNLEESGKTKYQGIARIVLVGCLLVIPVAFIVYITELQSIMTFAFFAAKFVLLDAVAIARFISISARYWPARLAAKLG